MSKYIDAEKLIAEIERWRDKEKEKYNKNTYCMGRCDALAEFRNHIVSLLQEQPKRKLVKVRCVFPFDETWEKNKIYTCEVWHHGDLNRNFWDVYYDYGKDPKYVQFPTIELLNEEFVIIQEESHVKQEQPEADLDLDAEIAIYLNRNVLNRINYYDIIEDFTTMEAGDLARHFYELGLKARK